MVDPGAPVTEDELHAYVDGELPAERRDAVERWLAANPDDAARISAWRAQADLLRARYGAIALEATPARLRLERITQRRRLWVGAVAAVLAAFLIGGTVGWFARGASAAQPSAIEQLTTEALDAHRLYVVEVRHPVEVPGNERPHLVQWLSKRLNHALRAPDLEWLGLKLVGGRLLPGATGPAAFFMYETGSGERFTLYMRRAEMPNTAMRYEAPAQHGAIYWVDDQLGFVLSGAANRARLQAIAQAAYDQLERRSPAQPNRS